MREGSAVWTAVLAEPHGFWEKERGGRMRGAKRIPFQTGAVKFFDSPA